MPRAVSPALSENEVDILGSLLTDGDETTSHMKTKHAEAQDGFSFDVGDLLDGDDSGNEDDGDEAFIALKQAAAFRKNTNLKGTTLKKGGGFQSMGLNGNLLRAITKKGFKVPTPIQRKTIPLILQRKDLLAMARTGSGKTAAFLIPMVQTLKAHSPNMGARALILSPSRELAIQTLSVTKDFTRGTDLKTMLCVGGDSLNEQFANMSANPDIIIATPGRFLHLLVEMNLNVIGLSKMQYVVFDEADRLFEMGFAAQLQEILHSLPPTRQTLLFSATLPSSVTEFVRAGCQDPVLIRLDADTKISPDLEAAVFSVKGAEKLGTLLHILHDVIKIPTGLPEGVEDPSENPSKKRKRGGESHEKQKPSPFSTIIFTSTKHDVEFLQTMLTHAGFAVSYVYGSLDQTARKTQVENFRRGRSNILVVTDVAARGIDIPLLYNTINYSFPATPKLYIHRVGRVARAGMRGWAYSLVKDTDVPYLLDLQLFLSQKLILGKEGKGGAPNYTTDMVVGAPVRSKVENYTEWLNKLLSDDSDLTALQRVSEKAEKLYLKTRNSASSQSARRAREVVSSKGFFQVHPLYGDDVSAVEDNRAEMMAKISGFKPQETIFEIKRAAKGGRSKEAEVMKSIRERFGPRRSANGLDNEAEESKKGALDADEAEGGGDEEDVDVDVEIAEDEEDDEQGGASDDVIDEEELVDDSDSEMEVTISNHIDNDTTTSKSRKTTSKSDDFRDPEFMAYEPRTVNAAENRAYGVHSGGQSNANANFFEAARSATFDLTNDEGAKSFGVPTRAGGLRWDKKNAKYVSRTNDEDGSRSQSKKGGVKMVRGESGVKIAATFQSGRFEKWRKEQRVGRIRVGEKEHHGPGSGGGKNNTVIGGGGAGGPRYKHKQETAPKEADKYRDDYHVRKKRVAEAREKRVGRFRDGDGNKKELKNADDIRRDRKVKEQRRLKNARRPSKKK
ncbi:ATP-dependent RNA helicase DBP10 [Xylaria cubensis]|nr:ATP-dependent RNA helicase DBP10 [Xylaria cubensis]